MKLRDNKGSITIFVLVGLLFMSAFLLLSYGSNVNKSKTAKEMFQMISNIYSYNDGDENAYMRAYTALRKQNAQEISSSSENSSTLELTKTFYGPISNYTIYGNSVQDTATYGTPSPDNPVEIQSVGDIKNLFDKNSYITDSTGILCFNIDKLMIGEEYTISSNVPLYWVKISNHKSGYNSVQKVDGNGFSELTFTMCKNENISEDATQYLFIGLNAGEFSNNINQFENANIQIEKGSIATDYEPYGYKIPVKVSGKNLFNDKGDYAFGTQTVSAKNGIFEIPVNAHGNFYLDGLDIEADTDTVISVYILDDGNKSGGVLTIGTYYKDETSTSWGNSISYSSTDKLVSKTSYKKQTNTTGLMIFAYYLENSMPIKLKVQLEKGTTATEYEPYVEPQIVNIYLDEPLRKVGDVADYIDFSTGTVVRNVASEYIDTVGYISVDGGTYKKFLSDIKYTPLLSGTGVNAIGYAISNRFSQSTVMYTNLSYSSNLIQTYITTGGVNRVAYTFDDSAITTIESAQTKIGDGFEVCYALATSQDPQTIEIPELKSYEDYTRIEVLTEITPSKIEVTYDGYTFEK